MKSTFVLPHSSHLLQILQGGEASLSPNYKEIEEQHLEVQGSVSA